MDAFGWSTQPPTAPSCLSDADDALLAAFLGASSFELHSDGGKGATVSSDAYGLNPLSCQHDLSLLHCQQDGVTLRGGASTAFLDSVGLLPAIAGAAHDGLLDRFAFANVREEPVQAAGSSAAFSGYSTTTGGGGNISSGESNTYGGHGHDTEVASPCAVSRPALLPQTTLPPSERKLLDEYPAVASATTTKEEADGRWPGRTRAAATTRTTTTSITFGQSGTLDRGYEPDTEAIAQVKEMIYRAAAMRPVSLGPGGEPAASPPEPSKPRWRKNVRISSDPQTVAARLRRERVSERLRALQRLVPGGSKMDTASMLDEAASYLRFLKSQLEALETLGNGGNNNGRSLQQRYMGRNPSRASNGTVLAFGRDGVAGYVKSNRNMQL